MSISELQLVLPATSANLGPAFDTAALALQIHLRVRACAAREFRIQARGRDAGICGRMEDNLMLDTYREVLANEGRDVTPLALWINNDIPVGKGLGSSAAARLAGIALAVHFGELGWDDHRILAEAARREGHGDNAAACWLGGFVLTHAGRENGNGCGALRLTTRGHWPLLVAIAEESLPTERSRAVLPEHYSRKDAVSNVQRAMLLAAVFMEGRTDIAAEAFADSIHEPYRSRLCPLLQPLRSLAGNHGILGAVLSGAGPSVLVILDPQADACAVRGRVASELEERGMRPELALTAIEGRGARQSRFTTAEELAAS